MWRWRVAVCICVGRHTNWYRWMGKCVIYMQNECLFHEYTGHSTSLIFICWKQCWCPWSFVSLWNYEKPRKFCKILNPGFCIPNPAEHSVLILEHFDFDPDRMNVVHVGNISIGEYWVQSFMIGWQVTLFQLEWFVFGLLTLNETQTQWQVRCVGRQNSLFTRSDN